MEPLGIVLLVAVVLGLLALVFVERRCWDGLVPLATTPVSRGGHGVVVRTAAGPQKGEAFLSRRLARTFAVALALTALLVLLAVFVPALDLAGAAVPSLGALLVIAALTALGQEEGHAWRSFGWALGGYVLADAAVTALAMLLGAGGTALLNGIGMSAGAIGCALAVAVFVPQRTYLRQYEDGARSAVRVGAFSLVARALAAKLDAGFQAAPAEFEGALSHDFMRVVPRGRDE